jgi:hypothetical protein
MHLEAEYEKTTFKTQMSAANEGLHKSFFHEQLLKISKKNKEAQ